MDIGKRILGNQPFPTLMGVEVISAEKDAVRAKLVVRPDLCTAANIMHGGAIMAFKKTCVFQTRITREDGKLVAIVTQTQMVLLP